MDYLKTNFMKSIISIIALLFILGLHSDVCAQTKFQTMMNQITGLETYLKSIKSVYSTTSNGLNTIHDAKNGSFTLNQNYFNSLKNVSPAVKNNPKIKAISDLQQQIQTTINNSLSWQQSKGQLSSDEINYMKLVYNNLLTECNKDLSALTTVVTDGKVQMTDKARIDKIDSLYKDMQQKCSFAQSFSNKAYDMANSRITDKSSNQSLQTLYNLN